MKNKISLLLVFILCFSVFFGCANPADVLDENVDNLQSDYLNYTGEQGTVPPSVLDTLDMMLDEYVSDLQKPDKDDIQHTDIDPGDDTDFQLLHNPLPVHLLKLIRSLHLRLPYV